MKQQVEVWYLYHSGFGAKVGNTLMLFDYYKHQASGHEPDLLNGVFDPCAHRNEEVFVFVSHKHGDHYNPIIFSWERVIPNIHYILSNDVPVKHKTPAMLFVEPENSYSISNMTIETFTSTDEGVGFLIQTEGLTLYHAGDLHWWHWKGEPDPWNPLMEKQYKQQIEKLKNRKVDIAFLPVDPRQEEYSHLGLWWFLKEVSCAHVFPMHFASDFSSLEKLDEISELKPHLSRIHLISQRGQHFTIE